MEAFDSALWDYLNQEDEEYDFTDEADRLYEEWMDEQKNTD